MRQSGAAAAKCLQNRGAVARGALCVRFAVELRREPAQLLGHFGIGAIGCRAAAVLGLTQQILLCCLHLAFRSFSKRPNNAGAFFWFPART